MRPPLEPLKQPPLLSQSVETSIRNYILDNHLNPGTPLPSENELARQLGVSRNAVREAVKGLSSLGIVESRRGSGLFVGSFSLDALIENLPYGLLNDLEGLRDLFQIRMVLETGMIGSVLELTTEAHITAIGEIVARMRAKAEAGQTFAEEDREFHQKLFEPLGNKTLIKLLDVFWLTFHKAARHTRLYDTDPIWTLQAHAAILDAVAARDLDGSRQALVRHYDGLASRLSHAGHTGGR
jgi:DNA-binding FadR family transcriptional regulator